MGRRRAAAGAGLPRVRYDPLAGRFEPPDEATIRRVLEALDASALDSAVGSWLGALLRTAGQRPPPGRRALAVDGKAVRGTRHASDAGRAVHLLAVADQHASAVLAQASVDGKTNKITCFARLLEALDLAGCVITADALHTQREHAEFLVDTKNAHYILVVKKNQPGLYAQLKNLPGGTSPPVTASTTAGMAGRNTAPSRWLPSPPGSPSPAPPRPSASPAGPGPCPAAGDGGPSPSTRSPA